MTDKVGTPPLRLLQAISGTEHGGGAEKFFVRLALALDRYGIQQKLLVRANRSWTDDLIKGGISPIELPFGGRTDLKTRRLFAREITNFSPDIVLTWMNRATRFCPDSVKDVKFSHIARLGGYYDLKYYKACRQLIVNTKDLMSYVKNNGWPEERSHLIGNFVSEESFDELSRDVHTTPIGVPLILAAGRLHENKGFDVLIKSLVDIPFAYMWIAGDGPLQNELKHLATKLNINTRIRFLGWRKDIVSLLKTADIFVCPSRFEPLGNVVLEAWATKTPVVAAASKGPVSLITPGDNGLLVPIDDTLALTTSIQTLINNKALAHRIGEAGYSEYKKNFTEEIITTAYLEFFNRVRSQCVE